MLCKILKSYNYDSTNNFVYFHDEYIKNNNAISVADFYDRYYPEIQPGMYTCVGLALLLMNRMRALDVNFPGLSNATSMLSCEESVNEALASYVQSAGGPPHMPFISAEKEHVMVGVSIELNGRRGILIADPGYHVGKVVIVMLDSEFPHTGVFTQHRNKSIWKQFNYFYNTTNKKYIEWHEKTKRHQKEKDQVSLIYIERPYLSGIEVTEKRNIVYSFKSLLKRDTRGNVIAGFYFPLIANFNSSHFTIFIGINAKAKYLFRHFINPAQIPPELIENIMLLAKFMQCCGKSLIDMACKLAKIFSNESFIREVMHLNDLIQPDGDRRPSNSNEANIEEDVAPASTASNSSNTT